MTRIEDRLTDAARQLRDRVDDQIDTDTALAGITAQSPDGARRRPLLAAAAAVVVLALLGGVLVIAFGNDESQLVADGGVGEIAIDPAEAAELAFGGISLVRSTANYHRVPAYDSLEQLLPNIAYVLPDGSQHQLTDLVVVGRVTAVEPHRGFLVPGDDAPSGIPTDFDEPDALWRTVRLTIEVERSLGGVEAARTVTAQLPYYSEPQDFDRYQAAFRVLGRMVFFLVSDSPLVDEPGVHAVVENAFVATVDGGGVLGLPALDDQEADRFLRNTTTLDELIAEGERGRRTLSVGEDDSIGEPLRTGGVATPEGSDLAPPDPGREINFQGVGDVRLGQVLDPSTVATHEGSTCGYWGPAEPTHDGDEPPGGIVDGAGTATPTVLSIQLRNSRYRTASGVGVGTTLASLQRIYGDDLVVDRADGWERPTSGLLASYQDVAAVRNGDRALTFYLRDDVVEAVKLSDADFWGDDEGCA